MCAKYGVCARVCVCVCVGGAGATKCGRKKKCKSNDDCANNKCHAKQKTCGGGGGLTQADSGESCLQIRKDTNNLKNGVYWINGVGDSALEAAFKVSVPCPPCRWCSTQQLIGSSSVRF